MAQNLIESTYAYNIIYVYSIDDDHHRGILKVGKATLNTTPRPFEQLPPNCDLLLEAAKARIDQQTTTAGIPYHIEYVELAHIIDEEGKDLHFDDTLVHQVLLNSGYTRHIFAGLESVPQEWFDVSDVEIVKQAIAAVKEGRNSIDGPANIKHDIVITFRDEQLAAIQQTTAFFTHKGKMLWNAKMRFGKTLCALEVVRQCAFHKTLILTHRPAVKDGWFEDFRLIKFEGYQYGSKPSGNRKKGQALVGESFDVLAKTEAPFIYFASMQDLRGSWDKTSGKQKKNQDVFATKWDLVIIDEAHEGTKTSLGQSVIHHLEKQCKRFLYLSGTPYNILDQFRPEEIYTWDYVQEQEAKEQWPVLHPHQPNPYEGLAHLNIRTYNLGRVFDNYNRSDEDYFDFSEFFRTFTGDEVADGRPLAEGEAVGDFVHAKDVHAFLDLLCKPSEESYYPFSREEYKAYFAHTFWVLPGVKAAAALSIMLQKHPFFRDFYVVNVAGEGDKMEAEADADDSTKTDKLEKECVAKVKTAIKNHERTITLSCGRMTTGVSIEQWTAVFMLAGAYKTKAAGYLQTIFRAQTPFKYTPGIKTECYAFDFAPDRTLMVIDDFIKNTRAKGDNRKAGKRLTTQSFLHFCSVIAIDGARTVEYDARRFMTQVNRAYAEHIVGKGFRDDRLYTGISTVGETDLGWIRKIAAALKGKGGKAKSDGTVKVTGEGLTGEKNGNGATTSRTAKASAQPSVKNKPKPSPDEQARSLLKDLLELVSVRMPMMIYGVVEEDDNITLEEFIAGIDKDSWLQFMPKGFTKDHFKMIGKFYNNDAFIASVADILARSKATDRLGVKERVEAIADLVSTFHYPDNETVLTPWRVVNMHMACTIGGYDFFDDQHTSPLAEPRLVRQEGVTDRVLGSPDTRILEINSKSGVYPLWLAYTLFRMQGENSMFGPPQTEEEERALWKQVVERNIFVVCKTKMAEKITRRVLVGYNSDIHPNTTCLKGLVETLRKSKDYAPLVAKIINPKTYDNNNMKDKKLKFNAVVGNPPYSVMDGGNKSSSSPIYNKFVELSKVLSPQFISVIMPAKWYTDGKGLGTFRETMLNDRQISKLVDFTNSHDCFNNVDIAGGVCYFLWEKNRQGCCEFVSCHQGKSSTYFRELASDESFLRHMEAVSIINKVQDTSNSFYSERVSSRKPFGLSTDVIPLGSGDILLKYNKGKGPYDSSLIVTGKGMIPQWKVTISYLTAEHAGQTDKEGRKKILSSLDMLEPGEICTETYLVVDHFNDKDQAVHLAKYLKTQFVRFLIAQLASTQHLSKDKFAYVPLQDFTTNSDIDWSASISDIDRQLYAKYGLSSDEVTFIEKMVKPMD